MFSNRLEDNKILALSPELESEFSNIAGCGEFKNDNFALAIARLFLKSRVPATTHVAVKVVEPSRDVWAAWVENQEYFLSEISQDNTITFCVWDKVDVVRTLIGVMKGLKNDWEEEEAKELTLMKERLGIMLRIFRNNKDKSTVVFTNVADYGAWHYVVCLFNVFCPWYIKDWTDDESELVKILAKENSSMDAICQAMNDMVITAVDVDLARKKYYLDGYEQRLRGIQREKYKKQMDNTRAMINQALNSLKNLYREYEEQSLLVSAIDNNKSKSSNELMNYFLGNKNVSVVTGDMDGNITYVVTGYMMLFDPEIAKEYINNMESIMYTQPAACGLTEDDARSLMTGIFIDASVKVRMCSAWTISFGGAVLPKVEYFHGDKPKGYLPNTHLNKYGCLGGWQQVLEESCDKLDYVYAVDATCAENGNLNLGDTIVLREFLKDLLRRDAVVLELPDGRVVNYVDAIEWIKENRNDS